MKSHRGLSSVVGAVFLIAIVIGGLSYISYSIDIMGNFSEALITEEARIKDKQREAFEVTSIDITAANKLDGVIKNTGQVPVKFTTLWIDEQGVNDVVQKFTLDTAVAPGNTFNLIDDVDFTMDNTKGYNMKLVTSRGEVQSFYVNSASQENIQIRLMAIPEDVVTDFATTLLMTVVNNMSNNNILVNLTPVDPYPGCSTDSDCTLVSGPDPASHDVLNSGDIAIFKWAYQLSGNDGDTFSFTSSIQNANPGNDDSTTVTIDVPPYAENSGVALESLGFGQRPSVKNLFVMHGETYGIPPAGDYQLTAHVPDTIGTTLTFNDISDSFEFFTANVTATDAHFPAGNWNASLRYYSEHLPTAMNLGADIIWQNGPNAGMKLHFEDVSTSTGLYDSGEDPTCYNLATSGTAGVTGATHSTTMGVNGSGAYYFDGTGDYLRINDANRGFCNNIHHEDYSIAGWFNSDAASTWHDEQVIVYLWDTSGTGDQGGYKVEIGDGSSLNHGRVYFTNRDDNGDTTRCEGDEPDGNGGDNYIDGNWHHYAVRMVDKTCYLYLDGVLKDTDTENGETHWDATNNDTYIGANDSGTEEFFGYIDDIMFWMGYVLSPSDITALFGFSFGNNSTNMHFTISNYTDLGVLSDTIVYSNDYGLKWSDQGHYSSDNDIWAGGNYTVSLPEVRLNLLPDNNRLGFTMSYASGEPLYLNIDDSDLDGSGINLLSTYLQPPSLIDPQVLPVFHIWDNDNAKVQFFAYSSGDEGSWFTFQGTRIIFNGTSGSYAGLVDTISDGTNTVIMGMNTDSPFIAKNNQADVDFWPPQKIPILGAPPTEADKVIPGAYDVTIYFNGYDEDGTIFVLSVNLGTITVLE